MRTHHHRGLVPGARLRQRDRTGRRLMTRPLRAMAVALAVLLVLPIAGCRDEVPAPEYQGGGAATRGGHEGPRPEGVSDTDTPITSTYYIPEAAISQLLDRTRQEAGLPE